MKVLTSARQATLIVQTNSRQNKLWLAAAWKAEGYFVEWRWASAPGCSRLLFKFMPELSWLAARSYEDDVRPLLLAKSCGNPDLEAAVPIIGTDHNALDDARRTKAMHEYLMANWAEV